MEIIMAITKTKERLKEMGKEKGTAKKMINFESINTKATARWLLCFVKGYFDVSLKDLATFTTTKNGYTFRHTERNG